MLQPAPHDVIAARAWSERARVEAVAAVRFARLHEALETTGASQIVLQLAAAAARDEARHAELCLELVEHFGGVAPALPSPRPSSLPAERELVLAEVVAACCICETISVAALGELRERARDAKVRRVTHEILRDEVQHSRLGWAHLAAEAAKGGVGFLSALLPGLLEAVITDELFEAGESEAGAEHLGVLPRTRRLRIFTDSLDEVVLPGLASFGVDVSAASPRRPPACSSAPRRAAPEGGERRSR